MTRDFAQMVPIDEDTSLFLFGYNKKNELVFRSSRVPEQLQNEKMTIVGEKCHISLYFFHTIYLTNLTVIE